MVDPIQVSQRVAAIGTSPAALGNPLLNPAANGFSNGQSVSSSGEASAVAGASETISGQEVADALSARFGSLQSLRDRRSAGTSLKSSVSAKSGPEGADDAHSATHDGDHVDVIRRINAFRDRSGGDSGGRGQDRQQQQQQRQQELAVQGARGRGGAPVALVEALAALRNRALVRQAEGAAPPSASDMAREIGRLLEDYSANDPVQQLGALKLAHSYFVQQGGSENFLEALAHVERSYDSAEVNRAAGAMLNASYQLALENARLDTDPELARTYQQDLMRTDTDMYTVLESLIERNNLETLDTVTATFMSIAGRELGNDVGPSSDPAKRQAVLTELRTLKTLNTVFDVSGQLAKDVERACDVKLDHTAVMRGVLQFVCDHDASAQGMNLTEYFGDILLDGDTAEEVDAELYITTCLTALHRDLPDYVFPGSDINGPQAARLGQVENLLRFQGTIVDKENFIANGGKLSGGSKPTALAS